MKMSFEPTVKFPEIPSLEKASALICWPVEWVEGTKPVKENLHVTAVYIPDVTASKEKILEILRGPVELEFELPPGKGPYYLISQDALSFNVAKVLGPAAFGPLEDVPVLKLKMNMRVNSWIYALQEAGIQPSTEFPFTPHVTVDLKTVLNPPSQVVLRPLELWYKDDEPVVI